MFFSSRILASVIALGLLAGTATPTAGTDADTERYEVHVRESEYVTFDRSGRRVESAQSQVTEEQVHLLEDIMTREPRYRVRKRTEDTGERDEYGNPKVRILCALYDMEDNLLWDWAPYSYNSGFGDYVIRMDSALASPGMMMIDVDVDTGSHQIGLWNVKTGAELLPGVTRLQKVDDDTVLPHMSWNELIPGVLELSSGTPVLRPFPAPYHDPSVWRGQIIATPGEPPKEKEERRQVLLAPDLTPLITKRSLNGSFQGLRGPYLSYTDVEDTQGILSEKLEPLYTVPEGEVLDYFDGELVLLHTNRRLQGERTFLRQMVRTDGTVLAEGYQLLIPLYTDRRSQEQSAHRFIGARGERVELLDRSGQVTASREIPRLESVRWMDNGMISYDVTPPDSAGDDGKRNLRCGLLDDQLKIVLEAGAYSSLQEMYTSAEGENLPSGLLRGMKYLAGGIQRWDVLDSTGQLLIKNLSAIGDVGTDRIAVVKGFSVGLMDWQGNWIAKESIFDKLEEEQGRWF